MKLKRLGFWFLIPVLALTMARADTIKVSSFEFHTADQWVDVSSGHPMRAAELKYDAKGDHDPVAVFYYFGPGQGGGIDPNINRWKGQFEGGPRTEEKEELEGGAILLVLSGTFLEASGGPFSGEQSAKPGYKMLAAVLPSEEGAVFVKLVAPEAIADEARKVFTRLVRTALKKS